MVDNESLERVRAEEAEAMRQKESRETPVEAVSAAPESEEGEVAKLNAELDTARQEQGEFYQTAQKLKEVGIEDPNFNAKLEASSNRVDEILKRAGTKSTGEERSAGAERQHLETALKNGTEGTPLSAEEKAVLQQRMSEIDQDPAIMDKLRAQAESDSQRET